MMMGQYNLMLQFGKVIKLKPLLLLYLCTVFSFSSVMYANITTSSTLAGATVQHFLTATFQNYTIPALSSLYLNFTNGWNVASISRANSGDFCENSCTLGSVNVVPSGKNVQIKNLFLSSLSNVNISIGLSLKNIVNPPQAITDSVSLSVISGGTSVGSTSISITINPGVMGCSAVPTNTLVGATTDYLITITPSSSIPLPSSGSLIMTFPSNWSDATSGQAFVHSGCSNTAATVLCTNSGNSVTFINLFSGTNTTSPFSFTFKNIINPSTQQPNNQLSFQYLLGNGSIASSCAATISGLSVPAIPSLSFTIIKNVATLNLTTTVAPLTTDEVAITFPSQFYLGDVLVIVEKNDVIGGQQSVIATKPNGLNQLVLYPFQSTSVAKYNITISNLYVSYPIQTNNIIFSIRRYGSPYSTSSCCNVTFSPAQTITASTSITNNTVKSTAGYQFTFSLTYYGAQYFYITFCSSFTLTTNQQYTCYISLTVTSNLINCTAISNSQLKVTLNNGYAFTTVFGYETTYILIVTGITNPSAVSCTAVFSTYTLPSNQLEYSNTMTLAYTSTKIVQSSLSLTNPTVGAYSDYQFVVNNTNSLSAGSQIFIYFPSYYNITGLKCYIDGVQAVTYSTSSSTIAIITITSPMLPYDLASHVFTVGHVLNLYSLMPSPAFKIQLQNTGSIIESVSDGVYAKLSNLAHFSTLNPVLVTSFAGQAGNYTISFTHNLTIPSTSTINLTFAFPSSFFASSCTSCSSIQTFTITNTTNSVTITQVFNPQAISESNPITVSLYVDDYLSIQDTITSSPFSATPIPYTVLYNSSFLGQPTIANITIQYLPISTAYLVITIPPQYKLGTLNIYSNSLTQTYTQSTYTFNFTITSIFLANVTINIQGLTNPTSTPSSAWSLNAYTSSNILIGTGSTTNKFIATCGLNCKQCVNSSYCLSCYNNILVNSLTLLDYPSHTCIAPPCNSNTFLKGSVCYACNSSCLTCSVFESNCTTCVSTSSLLNQTCYATCPDGYYSSGGNCLVCANNCKTCSSAVFCFTCASGFLLLADNTCGVSCLGAMYNYSNVCVSCPTKCLTCNQNGCLTCISPNYLCQISSIVCISACPLNYYISANNSWCQACKTPCLTCQNTSSNCTSCDSTTSNKYFYSNQCLTGCVSGTYFDQYFQCKSCVFPCLQCFSATNCSSCQSGYYLFGTSGLCTQTCLSNTILVSQTCLECTSPCLTCSGTVTTCATCIESYYLVRSSNTCTNTCSKPNIAYNGVCDICLTPCTSCDPANISDCTACLSGYFLHSNTCFSSCPNQTYANSASTCALCSAPCASCSVSSTNCTDCYNGSFLLNNKCYSSCPANYFPYFKNCSPCLSPCNGCIAGGQADQCITCIGSYYYNPVNYHCTASCGSSYYPTISSPFKCLPCQLPCKNCSTYYNTCSSCYNGNFLLNQQCNSSCPDRYFADTSNNTCIACPSLCQTCTSLLCLTCTSSNYFFAGTCYSSCPAVAPYTYGNYCRNCLTDNCLICNAQGVCTLCATNTYDYNGLCISSCPQNYELDHLTASRCVMVPSYAYATYVEYLQAMKIVAMPGSALWILLLFFIPFAEIKLFGVAALLALPQTIAFAQFIVLYLRQQSKLNSTLLSLPQWLTWALLSLYFVLTFFHTLFLHKNRLSSNKQTDKWFGYGSNSYRYRIITFFSYINKQVSYLLFSGFFNIPVTSLSFMSLLPRSFYLTHIFYMIFEVILILIAALICILKQTITYNSKLFYSSVDILVVFTISFIFDFVFLFLAHKQTAPTPYQKYVLPNVSNHTLPAYSDGEEQIANQTDPNLALHRSASDEDIFQSKQMKDVEYRSVIDNNDYFDETPFMKNDKIQEGIEDGKFRKKNKKKRGRRRGGKLNVIEQQSEQQSSEDEKMDSKKKNKRKNGKERDVGGLHNFIYWKKPKQKKKTPLKIFKENEEVIMSRIKQKESQFDTITQNDIIFQEDERDDSSEEEYNIQNESRRALYRPQVPSYYDNLFNLNYASKHHLT